MLILSKCTNVRSTFSHNSQLYNWHWNRLKCCHEGNKKHLFRGGGGKILPVYQCYYCLYHHLMGLGKWSQCLNLRSWCNICPWSLYLDYISPLLRISIYQSESWLLDDMNMNDKSYIFHEINTNQTYQYISESIVKLYLKDISYLSKGLVNKLCNIFNLLLKYLSVKIMSVNLKVSSIDV